AAGAGRQQGRAGKERHRVHRLCQSASEQGRLRFVRGADDQPSRNRAAEVVHRLRLRPCALSWRAADHHRPGDRPGAGRDGCSAAAGILVLALPSWQTAARPSVQDQVSKWRRPMAAKTSAKTSAKMPARIRHIALCVKDIKETADFYEKAFGLARTEIKEGKT